jgi:hypothetical protein
MGTEQHHYMKRERSRSKTARIVEKKRRFRQRVIVAACSVSAVIISLFWLMRDQPFLERFEGAFVYLAFLILTPAVFTLLFTPKKQEWHYTFLIAFAVCLIFVVGDDVTNFSRGIREVQKGYDKNN